MANLPDIVYTQRDPDLILSNLKQALGAFTGGNWDDYTQNDVGYAIVAACTALYDMNAFFCDQNTAETFLSLALLRESVIRRAKELGYIPGQAQAAQVSVQLNYPSFTTGFTIPANSSWLINNISFQCLSPIVITPNTTTTQILLTQGTPYTQTISGTGVAWTKVVLPVTASNITVTVNSILWTPVDTFIEVAQPTSYKVYEDVGGQTIEFGVQIDDLNIPQVGDTVTINALLTSGLAGNIYTSDYNVLPQSPILNSGGSNVASAFNGTTLTSAIGGADVESTASIRENAPNYYGTQGRAVSASDVEAIVLSIPGITFASAVGGETNGHYGSVFVTVYGDSPYELTSDLQTAVSNVLQQKGMIGLTYVVSSPTVVEVQQTITVGVSSLIFGDASSAINGVTNAVNGFFTSLNIGAQLYSSAETAVIEELSGTIYNNITTTVDTFATSSAGLISIPIIMNPDLTSVVLKNAGGTVLFSGDATEMITKNVFNFVQTGMSDQTCTLYYKSNSVDVLVSSEQAFVLTSLVVNPILVSS